MKVKILGARVILKDDKKIYSLLKKYDEYGEYWDDCMEEDFIGSNNIVGETFEVE